MPFALDIFLESLRSTLLPVFVEVTAHAMRAFGGYDMLLPVLLAIGGGLSATFLLMLAGRALRPVAFKIGFTEDRYRQFHADMQYYGFWMLLFIWLPIGFMMALCAGLFNIPLWRGLPVAAVGLAGYYGWVLGLI